MSVSVDDSSLRVGDTTSATATATYSDGETEQVTASWASSDATIASVNSSGTITAVAQGSATITGTYNDQSGSVTIDVTEQLINVHAYVGALLIGGWVEGATVTIGGVTGTTNESGYVLFTCAISSGNCYGTFDYIVEKSGFVTSKSQISITSQITHAQRNIIPNDNETFDLTFFDHVFRDKGSRGIRQWASSPTVEIWTTEMLCVSPSGAHCNEFMSKGTSAPSHHETNARTAAEAYIPYLTDGVLSANIQTKTIPFGTYFQDDCPPSGTVEIVYVDMVLNFGDATRAYATVCSTGDSIHAVRVVVKPSTTVLIVGHEIGHDRAGGSDGHGDSDGDLQ